MGVHRRCTRITRTAIPIIILTRTVIGGGITVIRGCGTRRFIVAGIAVITRIGVAITVAIIAEITITVITLHTTGRMEVGMRRVTITPKQMGIGMVRTRREHGLPVRRSQPHTRRVLFHLVA